ncbi:MAG: DUF1553 domain-containing protein [Candidatus Omnitrophica bacterium]|nr:DUF1553 domain-containing protein [Candidatus Omnitrophota bacterium]
MKKISSLLLAACVALSWLAEGQNRSVLPGLPGRNFSRLVELLSQLDLSPEQKTEIQALRLEFRNKIQSLRITSASDKEIRAWQQNIAKIQEEAFNRLLDVLTEDQRVELALRLSVTSETKGEEETEKVEKLIFLLKQATPLTKQPRQDKAPYEQESDSPPTNEVDRLVLRGLKEQNIAASPWCSDEVFIRRVYLNMIGKLPSPGEVLEFLRDTRTDKRHQLIEKLFTRDEFIDYQAMRWGDILRIKAEFPINLWPNGAAVYHRWLQETIRNNLPYDQFVRTLLTSSGSNFRTPPVNFFRAVQNRNPSGLAEAVALTFMGTRLSSWPEKDQKTMEIFFSRLGYKKTAEWKEEIVYWTREPLPVNELVMPDGQKVYLPPDKDPRKIFADWLIRKDNPWFARVIVNRIWGWFFGRGVVHPVDDFRADNPPVNPPLLDYLASQLVQNQYDLRVIYRLILNSRTYQQSFMGRHSLAEKYFGCYPVRPIEAEVLEDMFRQIFQIKPSYSSDIPEPFTYIPEENSTVSLFDGSITSPFLITFGRPSRDTGLVSERNLEVTENQRLFFINSSRLNEWIRSSRLFQAISGASGSDYRIGLSLTWLTILSRLPLEEEITEAQKYLQRGQTGFQDIVWALINSKEFSWHH